MAAPDGDQVVTDEIRASLQVDQNLSPSAKNIDIVTMSGKVTLRGTVKSRAEKKAVEAKARDIAGPEEVESQLRVKK
jgi:osmotically-inducible protein OsmY